jgi:hypothetical protein
LQRAERLHNQAIANDDGPERICGAGLIVLQQAVLAVEDLVVMLHALAGEDPEAAGDPTSHAGEEIWGRLDNMSVGDQLKLFGAIVHEPSIGLRVFRLPPDQALRASVRLTQVVRCGSADLLITLALRRRAADHRVRSCASSWPTPPVVRRVRPARRHDVCDTGGSVSGSRAFAGCHGREHLVGQFDCASGAVDHRNPACASIRQLP